MTFVSWKHTSHLAPLCYLKIAALIVAFMSNSLMVSLMVTRLTLSNVCVTSSRPHKLPKRPRAQPQQQPRASSPDNLRCTSVVFKSKKIWIFFQHSFVFRTLFISISNKMDLWSAFLASQSHLLWNQDNDVPKPRLHMSLLKAQISFFKC